MAIQLQIGLDAISSYKRLSYTPWHALAEFVDNSTQSYFDHKEDLDRAFEREGAGLRVSIVYGKENDGFLRIFDNAMGMSYEELERALHVAMPPKDTTGRSKYGMGLKTASCWIGNWWTVRTKKLGESIEHTVTIDVNKIAGGIPDLSYSTKKSDNPDDHFTLIEISQHNRKFQGRTLWKISQFLRSMYRKDFRNGVLKLEWQNEALTWEDLDEKLLVDREGKSYKKSFQFTVGGKLVKGWVGVLDRGSRAEAGFSIIQSDRVIRGWPDSWRPSSLYGQLQGSNDLVNQRLVGEIHLDGFDVSHTKDDILWLGDQEEEVERQLKEHCTDYRRFTLERRAKEDQDQRGPKSIEIEAAVDELVRELQSPEMVDHVQIEDVPPEPVVNESIEKIIDSVTSERSPTISANIGDLEIAVYVDSDLSLNDPYVLSESAEQERVKVVVNTRHPHWLQLKGSEGVLNYLRHCAYDAVAEWQAQSKASRLDPNTIKLLKDRLLRVPFEMEEHADATAASE